MFTKLRWIASLAALAALSPAPGVATAAGSGIIAHTNLYWGSETEPGRAAGTVETKDVDFGSAA